MKKFEGKNFLIVDDEPDLREMMADEFVGLGAQVFVAENGIKALEIVKAELIDVVISDVRMPGGDGMQLLKAIKQINPVSPAVLLITGHSEYDTQEAFATGAVAVMAKPFEFDDLIHEADKIFLDPRTKFSRQFARHETDIKISIKTDVSPVPVEAQMANVGQGGIFVACKDSFPKISSRIYFSLWSEEEKVFFEGVGICRWVRRVEKGALPAGIGIQFEALSPKTLAYIERLLKQNPTISQIPIQ